MANLPWNRAVMPDFYAVKCIFIWMIFYYFELNVTKEMEEKKRHLLQFSYLLITNFCISIFIKRQMTKVREILKWENGKNKL